jgi:hypothetical protein
MVVATMRPVSRAGAEPGLAGDSARKSAAKLIAVNYRRAVILQASLP